MSLCMLTKDRCVSVESCFQELALILLFGLMAGSSCVAVSIPYINGLMQNDLAVMLKNKNRNCMYPDESKDDCAQWKLTLHDLSSVVKFPGKR